MKKALLVGVVSGVLVCGLSWWVFLVTQQHIFEPEPEPMLDPVQVNESQVVEDASSSPQVKGVATVIQPTPVCVEKTYTNSALQISFQYNNCESDTVSFEQEGSKLLEEVERDGVVVEQVVLEQFSKPESTAFADIIASTFISRLPSTAQQGCAVINTSRPEEQDQIARSEIRAVGTYAAVATTLLESEAAAQPCGTYGQMLRVGYFEYHPAELLDRYVFVTPMSGHDTVLWSTLQFLPTTSE